MKTRISDPVKAQKEIKKMKHCSSVQVIPMIRATNDKSKRKVSGLVIQEELQHAIWWLLEQYTSPSNGALIKNLKSVNQSLGDYVLFHEENETLTDLVRIDMVTINGIETWLVQDFQLGPTKSKWFRGKSLESENSLHLAVLKFANIKITDADPENNREISAHEVRYLTREIITGLNGKTKLDEKKIGDEIEVSHTIEIEKTLQCFTGKSTTNSVLKDVKNKSEMEISKLREDKRWNEIRRASGEARKVAEKKFFNAYFGVDGVKEFTIDKLGRPVDSN